MVTSFIDFLLFKNDLNAEENRVKAVLFTKLFILIKKNQHTVLFPWKKNNYVERQSDSCADFSFMYLWFGISFQRWRFHSYFWIRLKI